MNDYFWWKEHLSKLQLTERERQIIGPIVGFASNFGYGQGNIRPGELGQWDVYYTLYQDWGLNKKRACYIAGLDYNQIEAEECREILFDCGVDPDNAAEVEAFKRLENMPNMELDSEIERLENILYDE